jgi:hypothetical protein
METSNTPVTPFKFHFDATEVVDLIQQTSRYGLRQMGMKDRSLSYKITSKFITLEMFAINNCLEARKICSVMVLPEFGPCSGAQPKSNTRHITPMGDMVCSYQHCRLNAEC